MAWKTCFNRRIPPSYSALQIRDGVNLLVVALVLALLLTLFMAICAELFFDVPGDQMLSQYGIAMEVVNTVLGVFYLRAPLRQLGFLEQL